MFSTEIEVKTINHLGLIAGIIDDTGLEEIINEVVGVDDREIVTAGQVVKGIILNGLGFIGQPLYLLMSGTKWLSRVPLSIKEAKEWINNLSDKELNTGTS